MNLWCGIGRLCKEPEIRTSGETKVARYTLAIDRNYKSEETDFINCVCFKKSAEFAEKYFHKGMKVAVTGRIQTGSYTNKDGQKINTTDIIIDTQEFCESKASENPPKDDSSDFMTISDEAKESMPF